MALVAHTHPGILQSHLRNDANNLGNADSLKWEISTSFFFFFTVYQLSVRSCHDAIYGHRRGTLHNSETHWSKLLYFLFFHAFKSTICVHTKPRYWVWFYSVSQISRSQPLKLRGCEMNETSFSSRNMFCILQHCSCTKSELFKYTGWIKKKKGNLWLEIIRSQHIENVNMFINTK